MNVEITSEQQDLIDQFKDITNSDDRPLAHAMLASVNWDLAQAVELQLNQSADNGGFDPDAENQANDRIQQAVNQHVASSSRRSSSDDEPMVAPIRPTGSSYRMNMHELPSVARREYVGRDAPRNESGSTSSSSLAHSSTASSNHVNPPPAAVVVDSSDEEEDDDDVDYDYDDHMDDEEQDRDSGFVVDVNNDRLPLVPSEYSTLDEALQNFVAVFESRYGGNHPYFTMTPLQTAVAQAFENQDISARKPLAVYLHNDHSVAANIFATQIMCSSSISPLLKNQFITWGWDCTYVENKARVCSWFEMMNMHDAQQIVQHSSREKYPMILVLQKDRSVVSVTGIITGHDDPANVMSKLLNSLDLFQQIKTRCQAEEQARVEREQLRQEQVEEYEASMAQDRAKMEERERIAREEREAEEARIREEEAAKALQQELTATLPAEPPADAKDAITIRLRYPDSKQVIRRFLMDQPLKYLVHFAGSQGYHSSGYKIFTSDFPRKDVATLDENKTFRELKWSPREQVIVEEI